MKRIDIEGNAAYHHPRSSSTAFNRFVATDTVTHAKPPARKKSPVSFHT